MTTEHKPHKEPRQMEDIIWPQHLGMDVPLAGCGCGDCEYARWFESLSEKERRTELELIYAYAGERDE